MDKEIIIGTRGSKLALIYAQKVKDQLIKLANISDLQIKFNEILTKGDQIQDKRLSEIGGKGLFSKNFGPMLLSNAEHCHLSKNSDC